MSLLLLIILIPAVAGLIAFFLPNDGLRRWLWICAAFAHLGLSLWASFFMPGLPGSAWIGMDALSAVFLSLTSFLFALVTIYGCGYVAREPADQGPLPESGMLLKNTSESVFTGSLLLFLATMSLAILSRNFGLQWMAIEATTLASAPLIYYHHNRSSLAAAWKYLILCSVGIAIALAGIFFISLALPAGMQDIGLAALLNNAPALNHKWLELAFLLMLVGYGTKMGLAPLHNWLPDAHSEASSPVSALLSGALLNCAFLGILRIQQVCAAAGMASFGQGLLLFFGLITMGTACVFLLGQRDYKRLLAYSSVEHMGILALGVGLGGLGTFGALLHMINHSLSKTMLFLTAGNIHSRFHTKDSRQISGLGRLMPFTGTLWLAGFLAIAGSPPFGTFISEFTILRAAAFNRNWLALALYLLFLAAAFIGMATVFLGMYFGEPAAAPRRENRSAVIPILILCLAALTLGLWLPGPLGARLAEAAALIGGVAR